MTPLSVLGHVALFHVVESPEALEEMTEREQRLLVGALNFHALMAPGRTVDVHLYDGSWQDLPRTTDDATFDGMSRAFRSREATIRIRSMVSAEHRAHHAAEARADELIAHSQRHVHISRDAVLEKEPPRDVVQGGVRRLLRKVRNRAPLLYDELRDIELRRHRSGVTSRADRRDYDGEFALDGAFAGRPVVLAPPAAEGSVPAVIIGLHWFELGGAERWAFETVRLVREAGFLPIVIANRDSHQPWIGRSELDGALVIPFSEPTVHSQTTGTEQLLRALLGTFDVRGVVVHHNQWLYDRLPWITRSRPGIPVVDSTHIVEYRGGGYPRVSAVASEAISTHHVISPSLARWMRDVQQIDESRIVMAPLGGLTVELTEATFRARAEGEPFTVAFVGRLARQKAPEVFVAIASKIRASGSDIRFILHGEGELSPWVDELVSAAGLSDVVERRDASVPVSTTLAQSHLLLVTSHNEGLTLTTLEAIAHGVPVVSTDVGAQQDIVPGDALLPRNVHRATSKGAAVVLELSGDEEQRRSLWKRERKAERRLLAVPSATQWFSEEVRSW